MNYLDLEKAVDFIETRWGPTKSWQRWAELYDDFAHFTAGAIRQALHQIYKAGHRYAPTPAEVMKATAEVQALRIARGEDPLVRGCTGDHVWAGPDPHDEDRHHYCVLCGERGPVFHCEHAFRSDGVCAWCPDVRSAEKAPA